MGTSIILISTLAILYLVHRITRIGKRAPFLPPGPPTVPILGNIHIFPTVLAYHQLTKWAREYGEIYSLKLGSGTVIVLSGVEAMYNVLDKQQSLTADRPPNHFVDVVTNDLNVTLARYSPIWRSLRRGAHDILSQKASGNHQAIQDAESTQLIYEILTSPKTFYASARRTSCSIILSVTYGKRVPTVTSKELVDFFEMQKKWEYLLMPGTYAPVDFLPFMKYFPDRFAAWRGMCKTVRKMQRDLYFGLLKEVEDRIAANQPENGCYMETVCKRADEWGLDREMVSYLGGALIEAGSDTTSSFTQTLILALVNFPEVQMKAHEELDAVVGQDRCPVYEDLENLPYIKAIVHEVHRFRTNTPLIPHAATEDIEYHGYVIPRGSVIFANLWGMFQDPQVYETPERFDPSRYLKSKFGTMPQFENDPGRRNTHAFGFGRRFCAGVHVAEYSTHINTLKLLWAFDFSPPKNEKGEVYIPDISNYAQALVSFPLPFECTITPRSVKHAELIRKEFVKCSPLFEAYENGISDEDRKYVHEIREKERWSQ